MSSLRKLKVAATAIFTRNNLHVILVVWNDIVHQLTHHGLESMADFETSDPLVCKISTLYLIY